MKVRVLGPFEIETGRGRLELRGEKRRGLLALLAVHAGEVWSRDRLVESLWGDHAPGAENTVQTYVSQVRKQLDGEAAITTVGRGYRFDVARKAIDLFRFQDAAQIAKTTADLRERRNLFAAALAEWRGEALEEFAGMAWADATARMAVEQRLEVLEQRLDADLRLGRASDVAGELAELVHAHPLVEPFWAQYMLALYRCGRQADALRAYAQLRTTLADELGIKPSRALAVLELRILDHDDTLLDVDEPTTSTQRDVGRRWSLRDGLPPLLSTTHSTELVGREQELETLTTAWGSARAGHAGIVLVSGEPGVGKTRLVSEFAKACHREGAVVLAGRCDETFSLPFRPFTDALEYYVAQTPSEVLRDQLGASASLVARIVPSLAQSLELLTEPISRSDLEVQRAELIEALVRWFIAMTDAGPVVVVLDDVQWADATALSVLRALAHSVQSVPLLIMAVHRVRDIPRGHPLPETLADLRRDAPVTRLVVPGLSIAATELLVSRLADAERTAKPGFAEDLHSVTEGNPFFVLEMIRHLNETRWPLADDGAPVRGQGSGRLPLPDGVREVLSARLAKLPDESYEQLQLAAIVGARFDLATIATVRDENDDTALNWLTAALAAGLVTEDPAVVDRFQFEHALVQETLVGALSASQRVRLHLRVARAIERLAEMPNNEQLSELAYHYAEAVSTGCTTEAINYGVRAANQAIDAYAFEKAIQHLERTLTVTETYQPSAHTEAILHGLLITAHEANRDFERAEQSAYAAMDAARRAGPEASAEFANAAFRLFFMRAAAGPATWEGTIPLLREALTMLDDDQIPDRVALLVLLTAPQTRATSPAERCAYGSEAVTLARTTGNNSVLALALAGYALAHNGPDHLERFRTATDELNSIAVPGRATRVSEHYALDLILQLRLHGCLRAGDIRAARTVVALAGQAFTEGPAHYRYDFILWQAMLSSLEGRWSDAEAGALTACELSRSAAVALLNLSIQLLQIRNAQDRLDELQPYLASYVDSPEPEQFGSTTVADPLECALANVDALLGRADEATRLVHSLVDHRLAEMDRSHALWFVSTSQLADACVTIGDAERATVLYRHMSFARRLNIVVGECCACDGSYDRVLGRLAGLIGHWDQADQHFADAHAVEAGLESPPLAARTDLHHAEMLLRAGRRGDSERARELLARANIIATRLGMPLLERQIQTLA